MPHHGPMARMFTPFWLEARETVKAGCFGAALAELVRWVDSGGEALGRLQALCEDRPPPGDDGRVHALLEFIEADLTDIFRGLTVEAAHLVPGPGWFENADPVETESTVALLVRYLAIGSLAAEHPSVPEPIRTRFREVATGMEGWGENMRTAIAALRSDPPQDRDVPSFRFPRS